MGSSSPGNWDLQDKLFRAGGLILLAVISWIGVQLHESNKALIATQTEMRIAVMELTTTINGGVLFRLTTLEKFQADIERRMRAVETENASHGNRLSRR